MTEQEAINAINDECEKTFLVINCSNEFAWALAKSIEALEKQIPKEPIQQDEDCLWCPNCDSFIGYESECKDEHYRVEYCPNCGQSIKWE